MLPDMLRNNDVLMRLNQLKLADDYTFEHSLRVIILAAMIGKWMNYSQDQLEELAFAGLLFDIGKVKVPAEILNYPGKLTDHAFELVKNHAQWGYQTLLKTAGISQHVKYATLQHHERMDGSGYPLRLKSDQISSYAKIIMVCDVFDAMTHDRVYHKKVSPFKASDYLAMHSGTLFDTEVVITLLTNLASFYLGKKCRLTSGEEGRIIFIDINYPTRPIVQVENRFVDLSKQRHLQIVEIE
jgi:HD-GYP domain-containing protein (c-di-GMP phosphodiesterase class II)